MMRPGRLLPLLLAAALPWLAACPGRVETPATPPPPVAVSNQEIAQAISLPPLSGLGCLADGSFLAVTDNKYDKDEWPPLLRVWTDGVTPWEEVEVAWPAGVQGNPNDLESIADVPGTDSFLVIESGFYQGNFGRLLQVTPRGELLRVGTLPRDVQSIEGSAIVRAGDHLVLLFGERVSGTIRWADLTLQGTEVRLGEASAPVQFQVADPVGPGHRNLSTLEVDSEGRIYTASTIDPPGDQGPFASVVWEIGQVGTTEDGEVAVVLHDEPRRIVDVDGSKVEALALCPGPGGTPRLFLGSDNEVKGGTIRVFDLTP
jgi:hypothetical protein